MLQVILCQILIGEPAMLGLTEAALQPCSDILQKQIEQFVFGEEIILTPEELREIATADLARAPRSTLHRGINVTDDQVEHFWRSALGEVCKDDSKSRPFFLPLWAKLVTPLAVRHVKLSTILPWLL